MTPKEKIIEEFREVFGEFIIEKNDKIVASEESIIDFLSQSLNQIRQEGYEAGLHETAIKIDKNFVDWLKDLEGQKLLDKVRQKARKETLSEVLKMLPIIKYQKESAEGIVEDIEGNSEWEKHSLALGIKITASGIVASLKNLEETIEKEMK